MSRDYIPSREAILTVGLFITFAVGFLVGNLNGGTTIQVPSNLPANYDPARAMADTALKDKQQTIDTCHKALFDLVSRGVAH